MTNETDEERAKRKELYLGYVAQNMSDPISQGLSEKKREKIFKEADEKWEQANLKNNNEE